VRGGGGAGPSQSYKAQRLAPGTSGVVILWEDPWADPHVEVLTASGVELVEGGRAPTTSPLRLRRCRLPIKLSFSHRLKKDVLDHA